MSTLADSVELTAHADVRFVLRSPDFAVAGHRPEGDSLGAAYAASTTRHTLVDLDREDHVERRRIESPLFRRSALARYESELVVPALEAILERLPGDGRGGREGDLVMILRTTFVRLTAAVVGLDGLESEERARRFESLFFRVERAIAVRLATADPEAVLREAVEPREQVIAEFFRPSWDRRVALEAGGAGLDDLLSVMIRHRAHFARWDPKLVEREALMYVVATAGNLVGQVTHAVDETFGWIGRHPGEHRRVAEPDFLQRALDEALRLHPIVPFAIRRSLRPALLPSGLEIGAGTLIRLNLGAANRDPRLFAPEPDRFDPDRAVEGVERYGLAFGDGPKTCIGKPLVVGDRAGRAEGGRQGLALAVLEGLFKAGLASHPERLPEFDRSLATAVYESYPVVFRA